MKILVAIDGSKHSLHAVQTLIDHAGRFRDTPQVELVTVHLPVPQLPRMGAAVGKQQIQAYYAQEGEQRLASAKRRLDAARIPCKARVLVGPVAETIVAHARAQRCELICIGSRGLGGLRGALGSTASKLLHVADRPVLVVK